MDAEGKPGQPPGEPQAPTPAELNLSVQRAGDTHVVTLRGAVRLEGADDLAAELLLLIRRSSPHLILDLTELEFLSSIGIGAIVSAHNQARQLSGRVGMVNPTPAIAAMLRLTRIDRLVPIFPTLESARQAFSNT